MNEIWKEIDGFDGQYLISNLGRVKSIKSNKILSYSKHSRGYLKVCLSFCGKSKKYYAHRLVAQAFIPNPDNKREVNHINGIKTDNSVKNLEWVTSKENNAHAVFTGLNTGFKNIQIYVRKKVLCVDTGVIYSSATEASKKLNLNRSAIAHQIARGGKCKGLTFKYC